MPKYFGRLATILFLLAAVSCFLTAAAGSAEERATRMIVGGVAAVLGGTILFLDARLGRVRKTEPKIVTFRKPIKEETQKWTEV